MTRQRTLGVDVCIFTAYAVCISLTVLIVSAQQVPADRPFTKSSELVSAIQADTSHRVLKQEPSGARLSPHVKKDATSTPLSGNSLFLPAVVYETGGIYAYSVAVADLDGDGKTDLLVADGNGGALGSVSILLGNGDGTFKRLFKYSAGGNQTSSIVVADLNGDGKLDAVVSNTNGSNNIGVLLGNGDGTFQHVVTYNSGGGAAESVWVGDVNGDGKPDILVADNSSCTLCTDGGLLGVLLGNGDGTFQRPLMYSSGGYYAHWVVAQDVDGDGKLDVVVANRCSQEDCAGDGSIGVLLGNGNGTFQPAVLYDSGGLDTDTAVVADVNGDGKPDIVVATNNCVNGGCPISAVGVLLGNGNGTFQPVSLYGSGGYSYVSAQVADVNGDGKLDLVVSNLCSSNISNCAFLGTGSVGVLLGNGDGTFQPAFTYNSGAIGADFVAVADVSGDGQPDLLVTSLSGEVSVLLHSGAIQTPTTTALISLQNPSVVGQAVTFNATVSSSSGPPPNGETITFKNGSAVLGTSLLSGGIASLTTSSLAAGIYTITASYPGDSIFAPSISPGLQQVVNSTTKSATATTLASSLNPSVYGQKVTWTATVTTSGSLPPTGNVTFTWGNVIGTVPLNASGEATLTRSNLNADTYPLTAVYKGDASNLGSTSAVVSQVITQATSSATLTSSPNPSTSGQAVTFTATITSPTVKPTGPVTFAVGKTVLGTAQLSGGKAIFRTSTLAVGSTKVTATYYGDSNIAESSASVTQTVQ